MKLFDKLLVVGIIVTLLLSSLLFTSCKKEMPDNETIRIVPEHDVIIMKPEYYIELISQDSVKISNGSEVHIIPYDEISNYIEFDNQ